MLLIDISFQTCFKEYNIGVQLQSFLHSGGGVEGMASPQPTKRFVLSTICVLSSNSLWPAKTSEETTSSVVVIKSSFQQPARVPLLLDGL